MVNVKLAMVWVDLAKQFEEQKILTFKELAPLLGKSEYALVATRLQLALLSV